MKQAIAQACKIALSEREQAVIHDRFLRPDGEKSALAEIGTRFGVSREMIRQIQVIALKKLRRYFSVPYGRSGRRILNKEQIMDLLRTESAVISSLPDGAENQTVPGVVVEMGSNIIDLPADFVREVNVAKEPDERCAQPRVEVPEPAEPDSPPAPTKQVCAEETPAAPAVLAPIIRLVPRKARPKRSALVRKKRKSIVLRKYELTRSEKSLARRAFRAFLSSERGLKELLKIPSVREAITKALLTGILKKKPVRKAVCGAFFEALMTGTRC